MTRCDQPLGGDCACFRKAGHDGLHACHCDLYGGTHRAQVAGLDRDAITASRRAAT